MCVSPVCWILLFDLCLFTSSTPLFAGLLPAQQPRERDVIRNLRLVSSLVCPSCTVLRCSTCFRYLLQPTLPTSLRGAAARMGVLPLHLLLAKTVASPYSWLGCRAPRGEDGAKSLACPAASPWVCHMCSVAPSLFWPGSLPLLCCREALRSLAQVQGRAARRLCLPVDGLARGQQL